MGSVWSFADREPGAAHQATGGVEGHPAQRVAALDAHPSAGALAIGAFLHKDKLIMVEKLGRKTTNQIQSIRYDVVHIDGLPSVFVHEVDLVDEQGAKQVGPPPVTRSFQGTPWNST